MVLRKAWCLKKGICLRFRHIKAYLKKMVNLFDGLTFTSRDYWRRISGYSERNILIESIDQLCPCFVSKEWEQRPMAQNQAEPERTARRYVGGIPF